MRLVRLIVVWCVTTLWLIASVATLQRAYIEKGELRLKFDKAYNKSKIKRFTLKNPYRLIFDIPDARLKPTIPKHIASSRCRDIRISQYDKNTVRVVIETKKAFACSPYKPSYAYRSYHIPLPPFKAAKKKTSHKRKSTAKHASKRTKLVSTQYNASNRRYVIVVDAGHGGHDTGAIAGGKREKDLVLQIAKRVEKALKRRGFRVYLTRRGDVFLKLSQRTRIADRKNADVFVSIHANSVPKRNRHKAYGIETYFLQKTRDAKSQRIAARENSAVLKGTNRLSKKILIDSVLTGPKIIESNKLAIDVQRHMIGTLRKHFRGVKDGGVRPAPFYVLVGASRPSILIEVGYISHPKERKRLFDPTYQRYLADAIAAGIESYLKRRKKELGF